MEAMNVHTWKELVEQAKIAEKLAKKFEPLIPKNKWWGSTKVRDATHFFQPKEKESMTIELSGVADRAKPT